MKLRKRTIATSLAGLAVMAAGCGDATVKTTPDPVTVTVTNQASAPTTAPTPSTPTAAPAPTPKPKPTPKPSVLAKVGDAITLTGNDEGLVMRVTLTKFIDPVPLGEYDSNTPGKRVVGVELRLTNQSETKVYSDSPGNGSALIYGHDSEVDPDIGWEACDTPSPKIRPGDSRKICIPFEIGRASTAQRFQFTLNSGFADETGEWSVKH